MRSIEEKLRQSRTAGTEQIDFPTLEAQRKALLKRIVDGDVFTLDDINKCRLLIMQEYPEYRTADNGAFGNYSSRQRPFENHSDTNIICRCTNIRSGSISERRTGGYASCIPATLSNTGRRRRRRYVLPPVRHLRALT